MSITARQFKALAWYCHDRGLKPQLSVPPTMYFTNKAGESETHDIMGIVTAYNAWNEEDKKERARERKAAEKQAQSKLKIV